MGLESTDSPSKTQPEWPLRHSQIWRSSVIGTLSPNYYGFVLE